VRIIYFQQKDLINLAIPPSGENRQVLQKSIILKKPHSLIATFMGY